jgi:hypothetical protein
VYRQRIRREECVGGVVEDEDLPCGPCYRELLPVQRELADVGVVQRPGGALASHYVVAGLELAEGVAGQGELTDELDETRVVGAAAGLRAR